MEYREERRRRGVFYGWWLVALAGVLMVAATVPWSLRTMPIWALAMAYEFYRAVVGRELTWALNILIIGGLLLGPVVGYLADRVIGIRKMVVAGLIILSGAFLFFSQIQNLWMFYAASGLMAIGVTMCGWIPLMTALSRWFVRRRATALEVWPGYWPGFLLSQADVFQSYAALWYTKYVSRTPYDIDNRCSKNDGLWRIGVSGQISRGGRSSRYDISGAPRSPERRPKPLPGSLGLAADRRGVGRVHHGCRRSRIYPATQPARGYGPAARRWSSGGPAGQLLGVPGPAHPLFLAHRLRSGHIHNKRPRYDGHRTHVGAFYLYGGLRSGGWTVGRPGPQVGCPSLLHRIANCGMGGGRLSR